MTLEEIMGRNSELADGLMENFQPKEEPVEQSENLGDLLLELAGNEDISDEELEMISSAAEQLGPDFEEWLDEYLMSKDMEMEEDEGSEIFY